MFSFKYCGLEPALFARADFLRSNFLWALRATRILPVAVIDARFFKYDFVFNFGIFYPFIFRCFYGLVAMPATLTDVYFGIFYGKIKFLLNIGFFTYKVSVMNQNKLSSRVYTIIKSAATAAVLPILFIYIMIAKPDYAILNGLAHIVLPVANAVGDLVTWPIRAVGNSVDGIHELSNLRAENEELQARLDAALANKYACDMAIAENKKLNNELNMVSAQPYKTTIADVIYNNSAFHNSTFMINRGSDSGIKRGNVVVSMDNKMAGIVIDAGGNFSRVRAITDSDSNIAVRIAGTGVYGFLKGNSTNKPSIGFFSDPQFQPSDGLYVMTSNISGVLPNGIMVGEIINETDVKTVTPRELSRVMVLQFDAIGEYK